MPSPLREPGAPINAAVSETYTDELFLWRPRRRLSRTRRHSSGEPRGPVELGVFLGGTALQQCSSLRCLPFSAVSFVFVDRSCEISEFGALRCKVPVEPEACIEYNGHFKILNRVFVATEPLHLQVKAGIYGNGAWGSQRSPRAPGALCGVQVSLLRGLRLHRPQRRLQRQLHLQWQRQRCRLCQYLRSQPCRKWEPNRSSSPKRLSVGPAFT